MMAFASKTSTAGLQQRLSSLCHREPFTRSWKKIKRAPGSLVTNVNLPASLWSRNFRGITDVAVATSVSSSGQQTYEAAILDSANFPSFPAYSEQEFQTRNFFAQLPGPDAGPVRAGLTAEPDFVRLSNGAMMPMLGFGTFQLHSPEIVKMALDVGYRHLDCAPLYKNEVSVGQGIHEWQTADPTNNKREQLFLTSKIYNDAHRPDLLKASAERTIADLGCGYLDMLLLHWPDAFDPDFPNDFYGQEYPEDAPETVNPDGKYVKFDRQVTIEQTWRAMESLVEDGLVRSIGASNFSVKQTQEVCQLARIKPVCNQVELHPFLQQTTLVCECAALGVQCLAYGPLGGPNAYVPNDLLPHPVVASIAEETGKSRGQVLVKWSMQRGVPVLVKTGTLARLQENLVGMFDWRLSTAQMERLGALDCGKRFVDVAWKKWDDGVQAHDVVFIDEHFMPVSKDGVVYIDDNFMPITL